MSWIFACDRGVNWKNLPRNVFCCLVFLFREITHAEMQVFLNHFIGTNPGGKCALCWFYCLKKKSFQFGKDTARKKHSLLHTLFQEKKTSKQKWGSMFFYEVEGHTQKFSSYSLVIGSLRAYLLPNCSAVTWVSNYSCPIWTFCNWIAVVGQFRCARVNHLH